MTAPPTEKPSADGEWTVGKIIEWTTAHLKKHGSDTPRLEAEILLAFTRKCPRIQLYVQYNERLTDPQRAQMRELVKRRAQAEPVAYLVGHREFFGLDFQVTRDVLVPRPETETLVLELIAAAKPHPQARILDLCTGSGCIGIAAAVNLPAASVTASDISPAALAIARKNAESHQVESRVRLLEGDLFGPLGESDQFDVIASNPPYVADGEMATLPPDVRLHEPHLALQAGPQGLDVIRRVIAGACGHLAPGGMLLIEFSPEQAPAVSQLIEDAGLFDAPRLIKDSAGLVRVIAARRRTSV
ncbi:MAG: peptide chain release factor N(5)-glutamine methyltransferase [Planctomycetes bacterium]|nr:peptide chain release factor N(5)-glutamine methyltransferase [Planctomycetota bacterium]